MLDTQWASTLYVVIGAARGLVTPASAETPGLVWIFPFVALLLMIAVLPLVPTLAKSWERNQNKLYVSLVLASVIFIYYNHRGYGYAGAVAGLPSVVKLIEHAIFFDYLPFIIMLFSLYTISGGVRLSGDIPAHPVTNTLILLCGTTLASVVGTTGASMLLIRPLLQINRERKKVRHTVIFFIFLVSNIGGCLLPVGDPPLFLGYLRGVPFLWTLRLFLPGALVAGALLLVYYVLDCRAYRRERPEDLRIDETIRIPLRLEGKINFLLLAGVVLSVALLVPGQRLLTTNWTVPDIWLREGVELLLTACSFLLTPRHIYTANHFSLHAISEVAYLFLGVFMTMQVPVEILRARGMSLGVDSPMEFFWATGMLSSFLDNAPTYAVFFELAGTLNISGQVVLDNVATSTGHIGASHLLAISCGAVFMGATTYIGNGPNFLVKSIAEHHGIMMPSFFGYMKWSTQILLPVFAVLSWLFF